MKQVILDTNFLVYCAKQKIDYAREISNLVNEGYELVVPSQVLEELEKIQKSAKKYTDKTAAKLAIALLKFNKVKILKNDLRESYADKAILDIASQAKGDIVATIDKVLAKRLRKHSQIILIEGMRKLAFA
jgi:rRNA-processing protein FCF1